MHSGNIKLIECPRDAMQGWKHFIPTERKVEYLNTLLEVGFDTIDFGSFVSAKAIPQMADTKDVITKLDLSNTRSRLLAIIANVRGAEEATEFDAITDLGFPFSVSETFQHRNTNSSIEESLIRVEEIQEICITAGKRLVIYISMGFGNPYGDDWSEEIVFHFTKKIAALGVKTISIADTVGMAEATQVATMIGYLLPAFPGIEIGVHLHSSPVNRKEKVAAAFNAGCTRFDGALKGIGGCPMANDDLVGNMDSIMMIDYFRQMKVLPALNQEALQRSIRLADELFN